MEGLRKMGSLEFTNGPNDTVPPGSGGTVSFVVVSIYFGETVVGCGTTGVPTNAALF